MKIENGRKVKLKIELAVAGGDTLEKNVVEFVAGSGTMLAGLEKALVGLEPGAKKDGVLPAKEAFGNPASHPTKKMKKAEFPSDMVMKKGEKFVAQGVNGMNVVVQIEEVHGDDVTVKLIHPLAEKDIKYAFEVIQVTDPRPPPIPAAAIGLKEE